MVPRRHQETKTSLLREENTRYKSEAADLLLVCVKAADKGTELYVSGAYCTANKLQISYSKAPLFVNTIRAPAMPLHR